MASSEIADEVVKPLDLNLDDPISDGIAGSVKTLGIGCYDCSVCHVVF